MRFGVVALNHRHAYDMVAGLIEAGASCAGFDPQGGDAHVLAGFRTRYPQFAERRTDALLGDPSVELIVCAGVNSERAGQALQAMVAGKDVMVDKPGATTFDQLAQLEAAVAQTGRIFSICFTERFLVPATLVAGKLIEDGAIGRVIQTVGLGPHRLNRTTRPDWFFDAALSGGILADIASHQIDQFLHFTGSTAARIVASSIGHFGADDLPDFQDFGEILLRSERAGGYVRVDWFTADGLPAWGDGRLTILGTEGTIELRKYVDIAGRPGTDHVFLVDKAGTRHIDASREPLTYFRNLIADIGARTQTASNQAHVFTVCRLALEAQAQAVRLPAGAIPSLDRKMST